MPDNSFVPESFYDSRNSLMFSPAIIFSEWELSLWVGRNAKTAVADLANLWGGMKSSMNGNVLHHLHISSGRPQAYVVSSNGDLFDIYLSEHRNKLKITFYSKSLYITSADFDKYDDPSQIRKIVSKAMKVINDYGNGIVFCADCGLEQKLSDVYSNRYFGGVYCDNCWNKKWKKIAEKETYN